MFPAAPRISFSAALPRWLMPLWAALILSPAAWYITHRRRACGLVSSGSGPSPMALFSLTACAPGGHVHDRRPPSWPRALARHTTAAPARRPLYGISGYSEVINDMFRGATQPVTGSRSCDVVCIDVNDLLHTSMVKAEHKASYFRKLKQNLKMVFIRTQPKTHICVFIDGPASHAKMLLQRERRLDNNRPDFPTGQMSSLDLTAGCELLDWLQGPLAEFLATQRTKTFLSDLKAPGEGEIKMIHWLREHRVELAEKRITIVGRDADLLVLALCALDFTKIQLLRGPNWVDVEAIFKELQTWTGKLDHFDLPHHPMRLELAIVTMMLGNDYFPGLSVRRGPLLACFTKRYRRNLTPTGHWALKDALIATPDGRLRREGLLGFFDALGDDGQQDVIAEYAPENCRAVLEGWAWCLYMYTMGRCPAPRWRFDGGTVSPSHMRRYLAGQLYDLVPVPFSEDEFVSPVVAALATLPYTGRRCVPEGFRALFEEGSPLKDLYPEPCLVCDTSRKSTRELNGAMQDLEAQLNVLQAEAEVAFAAAQVHISAYCEQRGLTPQYTTTPKPAARTVQGDIVLGGSLRVTAIAVSAAVALHDAAVDVLRRLDLSESEARGMKFQGAEEQLILQIAELKKQRSVKAREQSTHLARAHAKLRTLPLQRIEECVSGIPFDPDPDPYPSPASPPGFGRSRAVPTAAPVPVTLDAIADSYLQ